MTHRCLPTCPKYVPDERLLCARHWEMVPAPLQRTIYKLWNHGKPMPGHAEACASAIEQVTAQIKQRRVAYGRS